MTSEEFHNKYLNMLNKKVKITLNNNYQIIGFFNNEFYEDYSILINTGSTVTIKIEAIKNIELIEK